VHVTFGHKIIETATFRQAPKAQGSGDLLITEDNEYGTANEDAQRRDFTVNGLFLEPREHEVIDYVEGLQDLEDRVLRTIGKPEVRLLEDPVRIMRAVKFATRLDFRIEDETWDAMCAVAPELERSAPPRVFEEILRLMRSGTAMGAFKMLRACGALHSILPAQDIHLGARRGGPEEDHLRAEVFWRLLEALDIEVHGGYEPTVAVVIAVLFNELVEREVDPETRTMRGDPGDRLSVCRAVMDPLFEATRLNRREFGRAQRLIATQDRFQALTNPRFSPLLFARQEDFPEALDLFGLREKARGVGWDIFEAWQEIFDRAQGATEEELDAERRRIRRRPRRTRRGRRK
jgi:poly(A) polymerase